MGLDPSSGRQDCCLWQHVSPTYSPDSLYSPCNYCWSMTPSWLSTAVAAAHPNKTGPFLRARGTDGRFARHVQSPIYVDSRVTQGLEAPPRTSTSHLATDLGSRPPAAQSWSELSLATRSGPRTMEATCGNGYAPVRGMPAMMMMLPKRKKIETEALGMGRRECKHIKSLWFILQLLSPHPVFKMSTFCQHNKLTVHNHSTALLHVSWSVHLWEILKVGQ